jgi:mannose/fructose/N-acetylgalactosamine-specific phosphotransferase system component IID
VPRIRVPLGIGVRTLFLQCMWNSRTLQGPGFAWAMSALRRREKAPLMAKHMGYFNSTPALAPCLVAAAARMEEEDAGDSEVTKLKDSGSGPLSAAGDMLFWAVLRPLAALAGLAGSSLGPGAAAGLVVAVYNIPQALFRTFGVSLGYGRRAEGVAWCIETTRKTVLVARPAASALIGLVAGGVLMGFADRYGASGGFIGLGAGVCMVWLLTLRGASPARICITTLALAGGLSLVRGW